MEQSSAEISNLQAEKENEIFEAEKSRNVVEEKIIELRQKISQLRIEVGTLEIAKIKSKEIVSQLKLQNDELKRRFWACRNSGL